MLTESEGSLHENVSIMEQKLEEYSMMITKEKREVMVTSNTRTSSNINAWTG